MIEEPSIVLNCFAVKASNRKIPTVKVLATNEEYRLNVKPFLQDSKVSVTYRAKRLPKGLFEIYVAGIDTGLDEVEKYMEGIKSYIKYKEQSSLEFREAKKLVERALFKKLMAKGWKCEYRYGYYICYRERLGEHEIVSTKAPWLFAFYRKYRYRVVPMRDELYLFVEPGLYVEGADFSSLLKHLGYEVLDKALNKGVGCIAYRESEKKYRSAVAVRLINITEGRRVEVIYFYGERALIEPEKVRLKGNVLQLKSFVTELFGQETYEVYARLQRCYSFSLGTKESEYTMGSEFKGEFEKFIKDVRKSDVLPFMLSGVTVDIEDKPLEVGGSADREARLSGSA